MKLTCQFWLSAALALGLAVVGPSAGRAESLEDALALAYGTNPQILAERATLEGTNEALPQALANWRPTVSVTVTGGKDRNELNQACSQSSFPQYYQSCFQQSFSGGVTPTHLINEQKLYQSTYDVIVSQPLYRGGRTMAQTSQAYNTINAERGHFAAVEEQVLLTVVTDYIGVVAQAEILDLNRENEEILKKEVGATEQRYHLGELTHTDLYLAEAAYAEAIANRKNADGQLQVARSTYQKDVGQWPADLVKPEIVPEMPATRDEAESIAATASPAVVQAQYAQQAAEDDVDVVRGQLLPTITAQAEFVKTSDVTNLGLEQTDKRLVAQATVPIYEGGAIYSQSRAAQKLVAQRKQELDQARRAAVQGTQQSWEQLKAARDALADLRHSVEVNDHALKGLEEEARVGTRTVQDVLIQQQAVFQAKVNLTGAVYSELQDEFNVVAAIGRLTARQLGLKVDLYDADKHLEAVHDKWIGFGTEP